MTWYGIAAASALCLYAAGLWLTARIRKDEPIDVVFLGTVWLISYFLASRLPGLFNGLWHGAPFTLGGIARHGGSSLFGILFGTALYALLMRFTMAEKPTRLEMILPWALLAHGIGRIGCLVTGCCRGVESHLPWSITYAKNGVVSVPLHPTPGYEAIALILCGVVLLRKWKEGPSNTVMIFLGLLFYSVIRFFADFLRRQHDQQDLGALTITQWGALLASATIGYILIRQSVGGQRD